MKNKIKLKKTTLHTFAYSTKHILDLHISKKKDIKTKAIFYGTIKPKNIHLTADIIIVQNHKDSKLQKELNNLLRANIPNDNNILNIVWSNNNMWFEYIGTWKIIPYILSETEGKKEQEEAIKIINAYC